MQHDLLVLLAVDIGRDMLDLLDEYAWLRETKAILEHLIKD